MPDAPPPDEAARTRVRSDLDATLFVEAGAGSGKTTALVDRVVALVVGGVELGSIAAITFTEKAAAELRERVRYELERKAVTGDPEMAGRCASALEQLDGAAVGTLHSFARRILAEHALEAGLPPRLEVLDEIASTLASDRRWATFQDELLADPAMQRPLLLLFASGVRHQALRAIADAFESNWDLVDSHVPDTAPEPAPVLPHGAQLIAEIRRMCAEPCSDPEDKLRVRLDQIDRAMEMLGSITDEVELLRALNPKHLPSFKVGRAGRQQSYRCDVTELQARVRRAGEALDELRVSVGVAAAEALGGALRTYVLASAAERRRSGQLYFHDLLVLARMLLRDPAHGRQVRRLLHQRYQRLLLDEFQDTDPIQIELAVRIAALDPEAAADDRWQDVTVAPGRLFVVGDPKQSIYRFRRADIATFNAAAQHLVAGGGVVVELTANFRSTTPVVDWINTTFANLLRQPSPVPVPQARFAALSATRPGAPTGDPVAAFGRDPHPQRTTADVVRQLEADDVAAVIGRILAEGWSVDDGDGGWRRAEPSDVAVLVPARTSLPFLEDALSGAQIAYRAESSSLVYATRPVRDLLMVLRAVDDPTNELRVVSALRTPLLGCGDDDLFRFRQGGGRWNYLAGDRDADAARGAVADAARDTVADTERSPVELGLGYLRTLHDLRYWATPSELLDRVARDLRAFELGFAEGRPRDVWRRLRFVIDQARAWSETTAGNLRQYLAWVSHQASEGSRVAEAVLPETDDDAVRIMTVHSAKGLEFPIVILSGMSSAPRGFPAPAQVAFLPDGTVGYKFAGQLTTPAFSAWVPLDEQMALDERIRLLYVASTRARDHLVLSLHRAERSAEPALANLTNAELLVKGMGPALEALPDPLAAPVDLPPPRAPGVPVTEPVELGEWRERRTAALAAASRVRAVAATAIDDEGGADHEGAPLRDPGLEKRPRDLDLPPWLKGRYGTAVGRAVHGTLQAVDLRTGDGLDEAVAAQCEAEAVTDRSGDVRRLAEAALGSPVVARAARCAHWRELYACAPVGERLLEGYVDLLYRADGGLHVVDYKTAASADSDTLAGRLERYTNQGAAYALTVGRSTGEPVLDVTFLFLTPDGAISEPLPDLAARVAALEEQLLAGSELLVD